MKYLVFLFSLFWISLSNCAWRTDKPFKLKNVGTNKCIYFLEHAYNNDAFLGDCAKGVAFNTSSDDDGNWELHIPDPNNPDSSDFCLGTRITAQPPKASINSCAIGFLASWAVTDGDSGLRFGESFKATPVMTAGAYNRVEVIDVGISEPNALWTQIIVE